jgi:methylenetetrahydrofolate dehydrogenase (NADP+)/methenyltetrahydrofolate cyclohydrolase
MAVGQIIDGKKIASVLKEDMKNEVVDLKKKFGKVPGLAVVLVGDDPASHSYVRNKHRACQEVGIASYEYTFDSSVRESELLELLHTLNNDSNVHGILVQVPLPKHIDEKKIIHAIDYRKDVDGFHPINVGKMMIGDTDGFAPCTPYGCQILINRAVHDLKGKHVVVVGRSNIVGKPVANLLVQKNERANCIVTICHSAAPDLSYYTKQADILVVAIGQPELITGDMVKDGVVVIDVGSNRVAAPETERGYKWVGDVNFNEVSPKASAISPVPGGVGPMTITVLLMNTLKSFKLHNVQ